MDCLDVQKLIHAYLDGEFDEHERISLASHLEGCESCRAHVRFEAELRRRLRESCPIVPAPTELRARVQKALEEARPRGVRSWPWLLRLAPVGALAALVLVVVAVRWPRSETEDIVVRESLAWHRQSLPMDVSGTNLESIRHFFSDKVSFAVRPPVFRAPATQLMGARLSNLGAHRAAYLVYRVGPQRVSVFLYDPEEVTPTGDSVEVGGRTVQVQGRGGYNVVTYADGGVGYAFASDMDPNSLLRLVADFR